MQNDEGSTNYSAKEGSGLLDEKLLCSLKASLAMEALISRSMDSSMAGSGVMKVSMDLMDNRDSSTGKGIERRWSFFGKSPWRRRRMIRLTSTRGGH